MLGPLLCRYAGTARPAVVDMGSGTGLSARWAATWAASVVGIEPNDDMRATAEARPVAGVSFRAAVAQCTGLPAGCADVVTVVQAMHWMEPTATLREIARMLRPAGVVAVVDADWPPAAGVPAAEQAWVALHRRMRVLEARLADGAHGAVLLGPVDDDDMALVDDDLSDPHRNRRFPDGLRSWPKSGHLPAMVRSGHFSFTRELVLHHTIDGGAERFCQLMRSQGSYQGLRRIGLSDDDVGFTAFTAAVAAAWAAAGPWPDDGQAVGDMVLCWRVRLGVRSR